jgi:rhamnosyltransferase
MMAISCSIVVRAFNEENHIVRLLSGSNQQNLKEIEVILVDSGSSDSTIAIASSND